MCSNSVLESRENACRVDIGRIGRRGCQVQGLPYQMPLLKHKVVLLLQSCNSERQYCKVMLVWYIRSHSEGFGLLLICQQFPAEIVLGATSMATHSGLTGCSTTSALSFPWAYVVDNLSFAIIRASGEGNDGSAGVSSSSPPWSVFEYIVVWVQACVMNVFEACIHRVVQILGTTVNGTLVV